MGSDVLTMHREIGATVCPGDTMVPIVEAMRTRLKMKAK